MGRIEPRIRLWRPTTPFDVFRGFSFGGGVVVVGGGGEMTHNLIISLWRIRRIACEIYVCVFRVKM